MSRAIHAKQLFNGEQWLENQVVVVQNGVVQAIKPLEHWTGAVEDRVHHLLPAYVDLQVYGAGGRLFSQYPSADTLALMQSIFHREGTALFQPTMATNSLEVFRKGIDAVRAYWEGGGSGVHGLHLEGPWIHPKRKGAHIEAFIHSPTMEEVEALLAYGKEVITMITLAPEQVDPSLVARIQEQGIVVSAGHTDAVYTQAMQAFDAGIHAATHLYNAMSGLHHREPGVVGAVFQHEKVCCSIIPDGYHVDAAALQIAKKIMGERLFVITDAVTDTAEGPYQHKRAGDKYECNETLSGSALSMHQAFVNLVQDHGIEVGEANRMCSLYPARVAGIEEQYGCIKPASVAQFVALEEDLSYRAMID